MRVALVLACTLFAACAGSEVVGGGDQLDASFDEDAGGHDATTLPLGDAIAFADATDDAPAVMTPCTGMPDGTNCLAAPNACYGAAVCVGGLCGGLTTKADGTVCAAAPDTCHVAGTCTSGTCGAVTEKADGTVCAAAPNACHVAGTCASGACSAVTTRADGYNWQAGNDVARCCAGDPISVTSATDCGACGIRCNAGNGESCQEVGGHWFCAGCEASSACWSHCCSESFSPYSCAASDCAGNCSATYCPSGTHCVSGAPTSSDYCAY
jgi:hypothetical protein